MMKSNYFCAGISYGVLFVAACNPSIVDPIAGGPDGRGGQSGEAGVGSGGSPTAIAGQGGDGAAGKSGNGAAGKGGNGAAGKSGNGAAGSSGGPGGSAGESGAGGADCGALRDAAAEALESHRACTQDSDCELLQGQCLFPKLDLCGNQFGFSKAAHVQVTAAYDALSACVGQCSPGNDTCQPQPVAQCSQGVCLNEPLPANCAATAAQATAEVGDAETCSLVVRVDSVSLAVTGHTLVCGPRNAVDETGARASANAAVTFPSTGLGGGSGDLLSGPAPSDVWLFQQIYGDFGHMSAVSAQSGQTLFWGQLDYGGNPFNVTLAGFRAGFPTGAVPWAKTELGSGCYSAPSIAPRSWDLREGGNIPPASELEAADRVMSSAFVKGLAVNLPLTSLVTIHYGEGSMPVPVSEYVVIVSAAR